MSFFFRKFPFGIENNLEEEEELEGIFKLNSERIRNINTTKFYEILEVEKNSTQDEIRKAYKKKVVKLHPDKGGDPESFRQLSLAYDTLSNEEKRKKYDKYGEEGIKQSADSDDEYSNSKSKEKNKTKSIIYQMKVSLEEVYIGARKQLEINRYRYCESCHGKGTNKKGINCKCQTCKGKGVKLYITQTPFGLIQQQYECDDCSGKGIKIKEEDKCTQCKGERIVKKTKILEVDIDKGAPDKKRYVFEGESDEVPGALPGDVYVEINILKNAKFIRNGADLIVNYNISLYEALTGFSIIFEHLDKRKVLIKSRECEKISHGMIKTIKDLGMPFFESSHKFGNLYIRITVDFPNKLEPSDKEALYNILIDQKKEDKFDEVNEKYFLTDFIESEENTNHSGGKKEERRTGEN